MADTLDRLHVNAAMSLLYADSGLTVYPDANGFTPVDPPRPYVRVYATIERPSDAPANSLNGLSQHWVTRWYCHCVGDNEYAALAVGMRVRAALLDQRPTIAGRSCDLIREDQSMPPTKDDTSGVSVIDAVSVYRLNTSV